MSANPEDLLKNPEQIKQMISLLSSLLSQTENETDNEKENESEIVATKQTRSKKTSTRSRAKKAKPKVANKFDSMSESRMYRENPDVAKKLYTNVPIKRRAKTQTVDVKCRICGRSETISSSLLFNDRSRYKCNKCSSSAG